MNKHKFLQILMIGLFMTVSGNALAQDVAPPNSAEAAPVASTDALKGEAQAAFVEAKALYDQKKYAEAAKRFREAWAIKPAWKILFNIGQSEAAAKQYGRALSAFELYLAEGGDDVAEARQKEVRAEIERLRTLVGMLDISAPAGAEIIVDDYVQGKAPLPGSVPVTAGKSHKVVVRIDGAELPVQEVIVMGGQTKAMHFEKNGEVVAASVAPASEPVAESKPMPGAEAKRSPLVPAGWVLIGTGAAALIAGGIVGGVALSKNSEIEDACKDGECTSDMESEVETRDNLGVASTVLLVSGGAIAATGVVLLIVGMKKSNNAESAMVKPLLSPSVAGAQIVWSF